MKGGKSGKLLRNWDAESKRSVPVEHLLVCCQKMLPLVCVPLILRIMFSFFVAFEGKHSNNSSIREVSEVNIMFLAT